MNDQIDQLALIPEAPPVIVDERIPIDELPDEPDGLEPDASLVESIKRYGVLEPLILISGKDDQYRVADGRRRLRAARLAELESVPVRIIGSNDETEWMGDAVTIVSHATRRSNPLAEYHAIKRLIERGHSESEIQQATGLSVQTIRQRMRYDALLPSLVEAIAEGKIKPTVAEKATKLTKQQQWRLLTKLEEDDRITGDDVAAARRASVESARSKLDFDTLTPDVPEIDQDSQDDSEPIEAEPSAPDHEPEQAVVQVEATGLFTAIEAAIEAVREGNDESVLISRIMDIESEYNRIKQEGPPSD